MKLWGIFILVFMSFMAPAQSQVIDDEILNRLNLATEVERIFVLKSAENDLSEYQRKMFTDPENASDTYLWAKKVTSFHYAGLWHITRKTSLYTLGALYLEKSDLISRHIRGEVSIDQFASEEKTIERRKREYLDGLLSTMRVPSDADTGLYVQFAKKISARIHGMSVLSASRKP